MGPGEVLYVVVMAYETLVCLPVLDRWRFIGTCSCAHQVSQAPSPKRTICHGARIPNVAACDGGLVSRWYMQMILSSAPEAR